jgi:hypothetical protein
MYAAKSSSVPFSRESVMIAKSMFQRTLTGWATDVLALRKRGWDKPCRRLCKSTACAAPPRRIARSSGRRRAA